MNMKNETMDTQKLSHTPGHLPKAIEMEGLAEHDLLSDLEACLFHLESPSDAHPGARHRLIEKVKADLAKAKGQA